MPPCSLSQLVDLALGTPEVGAVNFNVLHSLLHALIKHLNVSDVTTDINDSDRDFLAIASGVLKSKISLATDSDMIDAVIAKEKQRPAYHYLEKKVARLSDQIDELGALPTNDELFQQLKSAGGGETRRPMAEMWQYMQMSKRVSANEEGIGKLMSLAEEMMKQMQDLKEQQTSFTAKIQELDIDALLQRLSEVESLSNSLNDKFSTLPSAEDLEQFVTWTGLEDALNGVRGDIANLQPTIERSHTPKLVSRPGSASSGPSNGMLDILERIGKLAEEHTQLDVRVVSLEEEIKNKANRHDLDQLGAMLVRFQQEMKLALSDIPGPVNVDDRLLAQLAQLKDEVTELSITSEKNTPDASPVPVPFAESLRQLELQSRHGSAVLPPIKQSSSTVMKVSNIDTSIATSHTDVHIVQRLDAIEEQLQAFLMDESNGFQHMGDVKAYLADMEAKYSGLSLFSEPNTHGSSTSNEGDADLIEPPEQHDIIEESTAEVIPVMSESEELPKTEKDAITKAKKTRRESDVTKLRKGLVQPEKETASEFANAMKQSSKEILDIFGSSSEVSDLKDSVADSGILSEQIQLTTTLTSELASTNSKLRKLGDVLNGQLHLLKEKLLKVERDFQKMARGIEFAVVRSRLSGTPDQSMLTGEYAQDGSALDLFRAPRKGSTTQADSGMLVRAQQAVLNLQAEVEKLHGITQQLIADSEAQTRQGDALTKKCKTLQDVKADKEYVDMEVDVKADKELVNMKVNHTLFESTTSEINQIIKDIFDKLGGQEESWKSAYTQLCTDIDGKLDRLELDSLKAWLEGRLKVLNQKMMKQGWSGDDDAAGFRKQLMQRFHCISCDRQVELMPSGPGASIPCGTSLPPTRSPRPYTTFELEQIRQHAKSIYSGGRYQNPRADYYMDDTRACGKNVENFEKSQAEKQLARLRKSDLKAFFVHFANDQTEIHLDDLANADINDLYATDRPCGGTHTLTYPHKRVSKMTQLSQLFREDTCSQPAPTTAIPSVFREELDVMGVDGHVYKGRMDNKFGENKLPTVNTNSSAVQQRSPSSTGMFPVGKARPTSANCMPTTPQPPQRMRPTSSRTRVLTRDRVEQAVVDLTGGGTTSPVQDPITSPQPLDVVMPSETAAHQPPHAPPPSVITMTTSPQ